MSCMRVFPQRVLRPNGRDTESGYDDGGQRYSVARCHRLIPYILRRGHATTT